MRGDPRCDPTDQAFPAPETEWNYFASGLTIREHFAALAMQGLLSNPNHSGVAYEAIIAVEAADALIAELNKETQPSNSTN